eukprot:6455522-Amphidinium_carterae.1
MSSLALSAQCRVARRKAPSKPIPKKAKALDIGAPACQNPRTPIKKRLSSHQGSFCSYNATDSKKITYASNAFP